MVSSIIAQNSTSCGQISSKPKPSRPRIIKAKAEFRGLRGQGHKILSSRCPRGRGQFSRTPSNLQLSEEEMAEVIITESQIGHWHGIFPLSRSSVANWLTAYVRLIFRTGDISKCHTCLFLLSVTN